MRVLIQKPQSAQLALTMALELAGGPSAMARKLGGISSQAICQWQVVPAVRVLDVERLTSVSRHFLRPDLYPLTMRRARSTIHANGAASFATRAQSANREGSR